MSSAPASTQQPTVVVAMSGGVDSSVAAALLKQQGYKCVGVFMRLGHDPAQQAQEAPNAGAALAAVPRRTHKQGCCSSGDAADARYVAGLLNIPFYALNFQRDFGEVIDYFVEEYNRGRTPNPCVRCNEYLKFGKLALYARAIGADYVATGHYARIFRPDAGSPQLWRGIDEHKDQSYVLFGVPKTELGRMLLPLGEYTKHQVRDMARAFGLPVHNKPDSQEICFLPADNYINLIKARTPNAVKPGPLVDESGQVVGEHPGHQHFTLGQRKGVGVPRSYPLYVTKIDPQSNTVQVGPKQALCCRQLVARRVNWLDQPVDRPVRCLAKIRYNSPPQQAEAEFTGPDELTVRFDSEVTAITPGQAVVCYYGPRVLGGGWIDAVGEKP